jgi:hypothetical protein
VAAMDGDPHSPPRGTATCLLKGPHACLQRVCWCFSVDERARKGLPDQQALGYVLREQQGCPLNGRTRDNDAQTEATESNVGAGRFQPWLNPRVALCS